MIMAMRGPVHRRRIHSCQDTRDELMRRWDVVFPFLGLARHKGYARKSTWMRSGSTGPLLLHRFSFEPVRIACEYELWTGYDQIEVAARAQA